MYTLNFIHKEDEVKGFCGRESGGKVPIILSLIAMYFLNNH